MAETKDVELARQQSVQSRATDEEVLQRNLVLVLSKAGNLMPPWWSRTRDIELRRFWKTVDHLAGAVATFESRMSTIPFKILPKDGTIQSHAKLALDFQEMLMEESEFGEGWNSFYEPFVQDYITQDNGGFAEITGPGDLEGPIKGMPTGVAHLDAGRCIRTGNIDFPVMWLDPKGDLHKLHFTRVIFVSSQPSPDIFMNKVGLCAVSRCINVSQNLLDILTYKQEKLGSRPTRGMMVTGGGLDPDDVREAMGIVSETLDNQSLSRYSKTAVVGHADLPDASLDITDLGGLPDGFDERESITLGMSAIALAFGVDARELFPSSGVGATRADALISHLKQRGKGFGQLLQLTERQFGAKVLPPSLMMKFDFQDDAQDAQRAEINSTRSNYHSTYLGAEILDERTIREQMVADGDITVEQFEKLELDSGRTPQGDSVLVLFFDKNFADELDIGIENVLDVEANDPQDVLSKITEKRSEFLEDLSSASPIRRANLRQMIGALQELEVMYSGPTEQAILDGEAGPEVEGSAEEIIEGLLGGDDEATEEEGVMSDVEPDDLKLDEDEDKSILDQAAVAIRSAADRIGMNGR